MQSLSSSEVPKVAVVEAHSQGMASTKGCHELITAISGIWEYDSLQIDFSTIEQCQRPIEPRDTHSSELRRTG